MSANQRTLVLYSTPACHLCETAHGVIKPYLEAMAIEIEEVDISESDALIEQYGIRIPVLRFKGETAELGWPFSEEQFLQFVK